MSAIQFDYPVPLPWSHRSAAMPWFPGGNDGQLSALRAILNAAKAGATDDTIISVGEEIPDGILMRIAGKQLQSTGLLRRAEYGRWAISDEADAWLAFSDGCQLIAALHSRVRFIGELLQLLEESPHTHAELNSEAAAKPKFRTLKTE